MEAASARMAARDRFGSWAEPATTPLQRYIMNACDPQNFEPNLALNLEIADMINAKKGNAPREAAVAIVRYVNHRNPNVSMLALNLLDICVKNCGYPFHLQISTKEFLNELVRRFPERPPVHPSRSLHKILELIEEWRSTICQTSRYKEDLGFIRDMHRLLSYKGYMFPEVRREDAAVLNPSDNLRSAEEMEEEERAAQSAKLQELIRRGTPQDLQEANRLMKIMAGYDTRNKTDYRAKAAEEVSKVQQKAKLLEDMLQGHQQGDKLKEGDVFEELANALMSAHPKIQKMCEEESEDHEAVAKLLEINDSIHRTIERYKLVKKGDLDAANKIPRGTLGTSGAGVKKGPDNELSLIDLGGPEESNPLEAGSSSSVPAAPPPAGNSLENDLLGLSIGENDPFGQSGGISLSASNGFGAPGPAASSATPQAAVPVTSPPTQFQPSQPNYDPFGLSATPSSGPATSITPAIAHVQQQSTPKPADPFAILSQTSETSRQGSPFQFQQSIKLSPSPAPTSTPSATLLDTAGDAAAAAAAAADADDEWEFASALPDQAADLTLANTRVHIAWNVRRDPSDPAIILIQSRTSNHSDAPMSNFTFKVAVPKIYTLKMENQSSRSLAPRQQNGITQTIRLLGVPSGQAGSVRVRWKATCSIPGGTHEETGEVSNLGIS